ncbi:MAG: hypothetical protein HOQ05_03080 [Corynebacteriales bacterium]|nr:hypothetical protein [Mycobacteriales bacterium]
MNIRPKQRGKTAVQDSMGKRLGVGTASVVLFVAGMLFAFAGGAVAAEPTNIATSAQADCPPLATWKPVESVELNGASVCLMKEEFADNFSGMIVNAPSGTAVYLVFQKWGNSFNDATVAPGQNAAGTAPAIRGGKPIQACGRMYEPWGIACTPFH